MRDWHIIEGDSVLLPYKDEQLLSLEEIPKTYQWLWSYRTVLGNRTTYTCQTYFFEGHPWWEWRHAVLHRIRTPLSIVYCVTGKPNPLVGWEG